MKKFVINKGPIQVKKDGVLYEITPRQFNEIKALIFEHDLPLCKFCKNRSKCSKSKDSDFIKDALTTTKRKNCQYVFECEEFSSNLNEERVIGPVEYISNPRFSQNQIQDAKYSEAIQVHPINEHQKRHYRMLKRKGY